MKRLLPVMCLVLGACQTPTDVGRQLKITVAVDHEILSPQNPVAVTITVVNLGSTDVTTADPHTYACGPAYAVEDDQGRDIALPGRVCTLALYSPVTLRPGDSVVVHDSWAGTMAGAADGAVPVAAGRYQIFARVLAGGSVRTSDPIGVSVSAP